MLLIEAPFWNWKVKISHVP
uniref:Uncharacterized protein n=1 Tax=Anguilla anguilla TaxID=7936 RepID=A0A0E9QPY0_ANGAN